MVGGKNPGWGGIKQSPAYSRIAASIVNEFKLSPMVQAKVLPGAKAVTAMAKKTLPGGPTGGIPAAHIHYKGQIYLLNTKQWKAFSNGLMTEFQAKMSKTKTVSFDQLQNFSAAVDSLTKK